MHYIKLYFTFLLASQICSIQLISQNQSIDYTINSKLDDQHHTLAADMVITYHNLSSDTLLALKMHTWMNVYKAKKSPFANQLKRLGIRAKFDLKKADKGGYSHISFMEENSSLNYNFEDESNEILSVELKTPIFPGEAKSILCHFVLQIPKNISRGGHLGQSYQMTQWYPKCALYDTSGWHTMPYLENGEYFNDFGNYDIRIELPEDYFVAATGVLQTASEENRLEAWSKVCNEWKMDNYTSSLKPVSSNYKTKIVAYKADRVSDFAWFADKQFWVNKDTISIENNTINVYSFYYPYITSSWKTATEYGKSAIRYFSEKIGAYPYKQVTLVEGKKNSSDAMEYPMITLIEKGYSSPLELEQVIVHEVGHNWFQGIVSNNERKEAWLDEGLVTYYEHEYFKSRPFPTFLSDAPYPMFTDYDKVDDFIWYLQASHRHDLSASSPVTDYSLSGYVESVYQKPAKGLRLLSKTLNDPDLSNFMKAYYTKYKFKHPSGINFIHLLNESNIHWFDKLYINSNQKIDVQLVKQKDNVIVKHDFDTSIPIEIEGYKKGKQVWSKIIHDAQRNDTISMLNLDLEYIVADPNFLLPETKRLNNILRLKKSPFTPKAVQTHLFPGVGHSLSDDWYFHPLAGYNHYDGFYPLLALHNLSLPKNSVQAGIIAGYGLKSKRPVIQSGIEYLAPFKTEGIDFLKIGAEFRTFSQSIYDVTNNKDYYTKLAFKFGIVLKQRNQGSSEKEFNVRPIIINSRYSYYSDIVIPGMGPIQIHGKTNYTIYEFKYSDVNRRNLFPHALNLGFEFANKYFKSTFEYNLTTPLRLGKNTAGDLKIFAGAQSNNSDKFNTSFVLNGTTSRQYSSQLDYKYDELLLGRNETSGSLSKQIFLKDAGFYTLSQALNTSDLLIAFSYRIKISDFIPIRPYAQYGFAHQKRTDIVQSYFTSGVSLVIIKNLLEVNIPLYENKTVQAGYSNNSNPHPKFKQKINFTLNLKDFNPIKWINKIGT